MGHGEKLELENVVFVVFLSHSEGPGRTITSAVAHGMSFKTLRHHNVQTRARRNSEIVKFYQFEMT